MVIPKSRKLEFWVMQVLWARGPSSMRDVVEALPEDIRPSYETVRSIIYRLQAKKVIRRVKRISNVQIFEAVTARSTVRETLLNDFVELFGAEIQPVIAHLIHTGRLSIEDFHSAAAPPPAGAAA
jgi:predicted transcriptional regulator